ncbi:hypothetical protein BHE90_016311 [Fusarium euwallaceae]|uniref:Non-histone chromosomal protein 6 n=1 Tax=Fusarium euwallaceae TaxID=1147111 RepID=A0A430L0S7_9HYPO|nr:hypothetical protein BHE90_016311 [Fusarium euwallaceae]
MKDSGLREVEVEGLGSGGGRQRMRAAAGHGYGITQRTRWTELVDWARTRLSGGRAGRRRQREQTESEKESGGGEAQSVVKGDQSGQRQRGLRVPVEVPSAPPKMALGPGCLGLPPYIFLPLFSPIQSLTQNPLHTRVSLYSSTLDTFLCSRHHHHPLVPKFFSKNTSKMPKADAGKRGKVQKKRGKKDPNAPKRGLSAYMFFANEQRENVREENPGISFGQVGKLLGERWKALNEKQRAPYEAKAAADKKRYEDEKQAYNADQEEEESS